MHAPIYALQWTDKTQVFCHAPCGRAASGATEPSSFAAVKITYIKAFNEQVLQASNQRFIHSPAKQTAKATSDLQ